MGACADSDGDGVNDCEDGCPDDPAKSEAGVCGCSAPEVPRCGQPPPEDVAYAGGSAIGLALDCSGALSEAEFAITIRQVPPSDSACAANIETGAVASAGTASGRCGIRDRCTPGLPDLIVSAICKTGRLWQVVPMALL